MDDDIVKILKDILEIIKINKNSKKGDNNGRYFKRY